MPNFRDPKLAAVALMVALMSALLWVNPPAAKAQENRLVVPLKLAETTTNVTSPLWRAPVGANLKVIRAFLRPTSDWGAGHRGVDIEVSTDSQLVAPHKSEIGFANLAFGVPTVVLDHDDGSSQVFQPVCLVDTAGVGNKLEAGEVFGAFCPTEANDGHCGNLGCVHWSYRLDKDTYINPLRMIGLLMPSTLLPLGQLDTASAV
jgi:hypothetical protein